MKKMTFESQYVDLIKKGNIVTTFRVGDVDDIRVNDQIVLEGNGSEGKFGEAIVTQILTSRIEDVEGDAIQGLHYLGVTDISSLRAMLQKSHGIDATSETVIQIIRFTFYPSATAPHPSTSVHDMKLYADGGSRGNPGPSAYGYALYDMGDALIEKQGKYIGITTNNQAEYQALKAGLLSALRHGARNVNVYMDSMLVVNQMKGIYKIKNRDLWPIHQSIYELLEKFQSIKFTHVPRELNKMADSVVNETLDTVRKQ